MKIANMKQQTPWLSVCKESIEAVALQLLPKPFSDTVGPQVKNIIDRIRTDQMDAILQLTAEIDAVHLQAETLAIGSEAIHQAAQTCTPDLYAALKEAARRIESYHQKMCPEDVRYVDEAGIELGWAWRAIDKVGIYVPGGTAAYPSSVLMSAIPAQVAGVKDIYLITPPKADGVDATILAAAEIAGINKIYTLGGAIGVAALSLGVGGLPKVDKIVGPGNAYVAEAKRQLFGTVGIDSIAGPSEVLIIADETANANWLAADLLAQAEHDPSARAILITLSTDLADQVDAAVESQLQTLPRQDIARQAWEQHGAIIVADSLATAIALSNQLAPEHLELQVQNPDQLLPDITSAGAVFMGAYTPEALGDYNAGPSHVLPTAGTARFSSGLSVYDFLKKMSLIKASKDGFNAIAANARLIADAENLTAHANSISIRL